VQQSVMSLQDLVISFFYIFICLFIYLFFNSKSCRNPCIESYYIRNCVGSVFVLKYLQGHHKVCCIDAAWFV